MSYSWETHTRERAHIPYFKQHQVNSRHNARGMWQRTWGDTTVFAYVCTSSSCLGLFCPTYSALLGANHEKGNYKPVRIRFLGVALLFEPVYIKDCDNLRRLLVAECEGLLLGHCLPCRIPIGW